MSAMPWYLMRFGVFFPLFRVFSAVYENAELASTYLARASPKSQQDMLLYAARTTYLGWGHLAPRLSGGCGVGGAPESQGCLGAGFQGIRGIEMPGFL